MDFLERLFPEKRDDPKQLLANELVRQTNSIMRDLVALRESKNLTQREVAERMGVGREAVAQLERHDANPTLNSVRRYALAVDGLLQVRVSDAQHWTTVQRRRLAEMKSGALSTWPGDKTQVVDLNMRRSLKIFSSKFDAEAAQ